MEQVREGTAGDVDLMDSVDRQTRGAAHGADHELMLAQLPAAGRRDTTTGSGYAYVDGRAASHLLAATNRRTATRLLWEALADGADEPVARRARHGRQRVGGRRRAGGPARALHRAATWRCAGMKPPAPYLHHGALL